MMEEYTAYLSVLRQLTHVLEQLTALEQQKLAAVRQDDLDGLNEALKQEQALSLSVRSLEQKRLRDTGSAHLGAIPLDNLAEQYPQSMRMEAKQTVSKLRQQYKLYQGVSESARCALECGLHEIEKVLAQAGGPAMEEDTFLGQTAELPPQLRTDIHA